MRQATFAACALALLACASAARFNWESGFTNVGLQDVSKGLVDLARHKDEKREARVMVRFNVPPSAADKFEDAWLRLEEDVRSKDKCNDVFDLKKTKLDNTLYFSYGEWRTHMDVHAYFNSKHFEKFADFIEDHGITWQVEFLIGLSDELEREEKGKKLETESVGRRHKRDKGHGEQKEQDQQDDWEKYVPEEYRPGGKKDKSKHKHRHKNELSKAVLATLPNNGLDATEEEVMRVWRELQRKPKMAHVLIHYHVPPGEGEGFVDAWKDAAEKTVEEEGNRIYALAKVATDNTHFYVYGTWESMSDYLDHFESRHVGKLLDYVADKDIEWHIQPLTKIGHQHE